MLTYMMLLIQHIYGKVQKYNKASIDKTFMIVSIQIIRKKNKVFNFKFKYYDN